MSGYRILVCLFRYGVLFVQGFHAQEIPRDALEGCLCLIRCGLGIFDRLLIVKGIDEHEQLIFNNPVPFFGIDGPDPARDLWHDPGHIFRLNGSNGGIRPVDRSLDDVMDNYLGYCRGGVHLFIHGRCRIISAGKNPCTNDESDQKRNEPLHESPPYKVPIAARREASPFA